MFLLPLFFSYLIVCYLVNTHTHIVSSHLKAVFYCQQTTQSVPGTNGYTSFPQQEWLYMMENKNWYTVLVWLVCFRHTMFSTGQFSCCLCDVVFLLSEVRYFVMNHICDLRIKFVVFIGCGIMEKWGCWYVWWCIFNTTSPAWAKLRLWNRFLSLCDQLFRKWMHFTIICYRKNWKWSSLFFHSQLVSRVSVCWFLSKSYCPVSKHALFTVA